MFFQDLACKWSTLELSDFDHNILNNNPEVKNWINILSHRFKIPTSVGVGFLTNVTDLVDNAYT